MIIGPKYKLARRLGAPIFEKTQTQKFALSQARKERKFSRPKSEFGTQLIEKQKARFMYALTEKQFSRYAKEALAKKDTQTAARLFEKLELRADSAVYRAGFASTRLAARQMVSHGHIMVNSQRITIPSYRLSLNDVISIRPTSMAKPLFADLDERLKARTQPSWIAFDHEKKTATVQGMPKFDAAESMFDVSAILEFYSR
jgi:small subunit ribosomal protein S4